MWARNTLWCLKFLSVAIPYTPKWALDAGQCTVLGKDCTAPARVKDVPEVSHRSDLFKEGQLWAPWARFTQQNLGSPSGHILAPFSTTCPPISFPLAAVCQRSLQPRTGKKEARIRVACAVLSIAIAISVSSPSATVQEGNSSLGQKRYRQKGKWID